MLYLTSLKIAADFLNNLILYIIDYKFTFHLFFLKKILFFHPSSSNDNIVN